VVGSSERIHTDSLRRYRAAVLEAAAVISRRLGYRGRIR
jgi:IclR family KDG regulon transcriptional repressor